MEVLLIEKETFDTIVDEHEMLCDMVNTLATHIRKRLPDELLSVSDVCEFLKISQTTLYNLRMSGKIGFVRDTDNAIRFPLREVMAYLERNGVQLKPIKYG